MIVKVMICKLRCNVCQVMMVGSFNTEAELLEAAKLNKWGVADADPPLHLCPVCLSRIPTGSVNPPTSPATILSPPPSGDE